MVCSYGNMKWIGVIALGLVAAGCGEEEKKPANPNVVATYSNGEITVEDLENYIEKVTKGLKVMVGDSLVALKDQIPKEKEIYYGLIREIMLDDLVKLEIKERQLDKRANIRHALQHLEEEITLQQLHEEMHEKDRIPVDEVEIQQYYDQNRSRFGDKSLYEVRDEIKLILSSRKEGTYVEGYIDELRDAATITKNYEILRVAEPTTDEVWDAYVKDKETYAKPEKWVIEQIEVADTTAKAKETARRIQVKLGAGESFEVLAEKFGRDRTFTVIDYVKGTRGEAFDKTVTSLNPGEFSNPIREGGRYCIVRLKERIPASTIPFEEVQGMVRRLLMDEREKKRYEENENKTLYTLHGRRFTLGDFYQEFMELPPAEQEKYQTYEQRVMLVDLMIERLLLLEDSYDRMLNAKSKEEIEHVREDVLKQVLHREEVDKQLEVSDEEVKEFYEQNKERFMVPPRVKISIVVVRRGESEEENSRAEEKIQEAYDKLKSGFFKKGMLFEEVAGQYSEDPATVRNGGKLDYWIEEGGDPMYELFNHPFHAKFMDLREGEITKPFSIGNEYIIAKIRERQGPRQRSFSEVKDHLKGDLTLNKHEELTARMYNDMIDQANLVIYDQVLDSIISKEEEVSVSR